MPVIAGDPIPVTTVAPGVVVQELVQPTGSCEQSDSREHVYVMQSRPVALAQRRWEGSQREGSMPTGELSLLPAGLPMTWAWSGSVQSLHVSVRADAADELAGASLRRRRLEMAPSFSVDDLLARHLLEALRVEAASPSTDPLKAEALVQALLERTALGRPDAAVSRQRRLSVARLNEILSWVDDNLAEPISTAQLAALAGVETSWFTRLFTATVGYPPYRYVLRRRVLHAQHALRGGASAATAAAASGFVDQAHLTRHFTKLVGCPPVAWAQAAR